MTDLQRRARDYWRANLMLVAKLLTVWFLASFGCGILFVDALNTITVGGVKLGFFFAQQGSVYVFVALIFVYVQQMKKLDRHFDVHED